MNKSNTHLTYSQDFAIRDFPGSVKVRLQLFFQALNFFSWPTWSLTNDCAEDTLTEGGEIKIDSGIVPSRNFLLKKSERIMSFKTETLWSGLYKHEDGSLFLLTKSTSSLVQDKLERISLSDINSLLEKRGIKKRRFVFV